MMIRFHNLQVMHFLWLALGLGFFLWLSANYKNTRMQKFAHAKLIDALAASRYRSRERLKSILLIVVFILFALALARPQWGFHWQEIKRQGLDIIIAVDVSKSMLADDVKPNRLERAKLAVKDLIRKLDGDRIGLVAFAGDAFLVCPLTIDYSGFLLSLEDLGPHTVSRGGTNLSAAILESIKGHQNAASDYRVVVLITDGENHEQDPIVAAKQAQAKGIPIFCIGVGTPEGALVRVVNEKGNWEFIKDRQGNFIKSRLDEQTLQNIALLTSGAYVRASGAQFGLDYLYETRISKMEKREIEAQMKKQHIDRFYVPLALALVLLVAETFISTRKRT